MIEGLGGGVIDVEGGGLFEGGEGGGPGGGEGREPGGEAADGVALAPEFEDFGRKEFAGFGFVVGGVAAHAKGVEDEDDGAVAVGGDGAGLAGGGPDIEDVVAIGEEGGDTVGVPEGGKVGAGVGVGAGTEGHLIILNTKNNGELKSSGEANAFVKLAASGGAVAGPADGDAVLVV